MPNAKTLINAHPKDLTHKFLSAALEDENAKINANASRDAKRLQAKFVRAGQPVDAVRISPLLFAGVPWCVECCLNAPILERERQGFLLAFFMLLVLGLKTNRIESKKVLPTWT